MGKAFADAFPTADNVFQEASDALGIDMRKLCFSGSNEELARTENTQPALVTVSVAQARVSSEIDGMTPAVIAGHSLGEITALTLAGAIDFADAVRLARQRGELMTIAVPKGQSLMLAVRTRDHDTVQQLCSEIAEETLEILQISNHNSNSQVVVSGHKQSVLRLHERIEALEIQSTPLNVSAPFHCGLMQDVQAPLRDMLDSMTFNELQVPVLSNATGELYGSSADIPELLTRQVVEPVQWIRNQRWMRMNGITFGVEFGPGRTLTGLMRHTFGEIPTFAYDIPKDRERLTTYLDRITVPVLARALGIAVATRNENHDPAEYQELVVQPYKEFETLSRQVDRENRAASDDEVEQGRQLLLQILRGKRVDEAEIKERFKQLARDSRLAS